MEEKKDDVPPIALLSEDKLNVLRQMPIFLLKMQVKSIGVDAAKYPELTEKEKVKPTKGKSWTTLTQIVF